MNDQYVIAILGAVITLYLFDRKMSAVALGQIAEKLDKINDSLQNFVSKSDCQVDMGVHCKRIDDLTVKVDQNSSDIIKLKGKHNLQ